MTPAQALYDTVHDYGAAEIAAALGMSAQVLLNKANPHNASNHASLHDVDRIMAKTQDFRVLESLALKHGFVLARTPTGLECDADAVGAMASALGAGGEVADAIIEMLRDGRVERAEVDRVALAVFHAQQKFASLEPVFRGMQDD